MLMSTPRPLLERFQRTFIVILSITHLSGVDDGGYRGPVCRVARGLGRASRTADGYSDGNTLLSPDL